MNSSLAKCMCLLTLIFGLAGCGAGNGSNGFASDETLAEDSAENLATIAGNAIKGPINGAEIVLIYFDEFGEEASIAAANPPVLTNPDGSYEFLLPLDDIPENIGSAIVRTVGGTMGPNNSPAPMLESVVPDLSAALAEDAQLGSHLSAASSVAAGLLKLDAQQTATKPSASTARALIERVESQLGVSLDEDPNDAGTSIASLNTTFDELLELDTAPENIEAVNDYIGFLSANLASVSGRLDGSMQDPSNPGIDMSASLASIGDGRLSSLFPEGPVQVLQAVQSRTATKDGDVTGPSIVSAIAISNTEVIVTFSEPLKVDGIANLDNYIMTEVSVDGQQEASGRLKITGAKLIDNDYLSVLLNTQSQSDIRYLLKVTNLLDLAGNPFKIPEKGLEGLDPSTMLVSGIAPSGDEFVDSDGDGLSDTDELRGWRIVTRTAAGYETVYNVTSDPNNPDTDGDGVTDNEEKHGAMNPRSADTDGDTLTDDQEWNTIFSDPTNQDSDGDSVQDGFEYYTFGTSPILADTDGDQIDDLAEVTAGNRNPLIADLPQVRVSIGSLNLQLNTQFSFTDGQGTTQTVSQTNEAQLTSSQELSNQKSNGSSTELTIEKSRELNAEVGFTAEKGPSASLSASVSQTNKDVNSTSFSASQESSSSAGKAYTDSLQTESELSITSSVSRELIGANIKAFVMVESLSDVPFTVSNLELSLQSQNPLNRKEVIPIAALVPENSSFDSINLGVFGDAAKGPFIFSTIEGLVFPEQVESLMKSPTGLLAKLANYDVTDELGRNFSYASQEVLDRTVLISFDFGNGEQESYRIATASAHNPANGEPLGITMEHALSIIGLQRYETIRDGGNGIVDTFAQGDDEQLVGLGSSVEPGTVIISAGPDGIIDSVPGDDDIVEQADYATRVTEGTDSIVDGGDGIVSTSVTDDDIQLVARGKSVARIEQTLINAGADGILSTVPGGDDVIKTGLAPHRTLTRFRGYETNTLERRYWYLFESVESLAVDFDNKILRAGESYSFTYIKDQDGDGVWASEEYLHGSSDLEANADRATCAYDYDNWSSARGPAFTVPLPCDFLSDKEEVQIGWTVKLTNAAAAYRVYSDPWEWDVDNDFVPDHMERDCGLDPRSADTDGDGLSDFQELYGHTFNESTNTSELLWSVDPVTGDNVHEMFRYFGPGEGYLNTRFNLSLVDHPMIGNGSGKRCVAYGLAFNGDGYSTNPLNPDTDGDGITDGRELQLGLHPNYREDGYGALDNDDDGLSNAFEETPRELRYDTNINPPKNSTWISGVISNPNSADSDGDYLPDLLEFYLGSNPNDPDTDNDLLGDYDEYVSGGQACVSGFLGQPCFKWVAIAGQGEGTYRDFVAACEAVSGCDLEKLEADLQYSDATGTDLNSSDTDNDQLSDWNELNWWLTDPLRPDTDGDGCLDGEELNAGQDRTDPNNPLDCSP
jgi:hypothetical protein